MVRGRVTGGHVLLLDVDALDKLVGVKAITNRLERAGYTIRDWKEKPSPSGRGIHVRILTHEEMRSPLEVVALQAICGSDPVREAFNVRRVRSLTRVPRWWSERWNVLYQEEIR